MLEVSESLLVLGRPGLQQVGLTCQSYLGYHSTTDSLPLRENQCLDKSLSRQALPLPPHPHCIPGWRSLNMLRLGTISLAVAFILLICS